MFSLQKLLGQEDKILGLLEASAEEARASVQSLVKLSKDLENPSPRDDLASARLKERRIAEQLRETVYTTFVTAIEREDIEALSNALYKVPKTIEKFTDRARLTPEYVRGVDFSPQLSLLERATDLVLELVRSLRDGMKPGRIKDLNDQLHALEAEADRYMIAIYKDLYSGSHAPVQVLVLKDLYELLEKIIDRCGDAGKVIAHVALKNS